MSEDKPTQASHPDSPNDALEEILNREVACPWCRHFHQLTDGDFRVITQYIKDNYRSNAEILKALKDEDYVMDSNRPSNEPDVMYGNITRSQIRDQLNLTKSSEEKV